MRNRQAGLTLVETVLVLLVAAIIIGGIWIAYSQVRLNQQVDDTVAVIDQTVQVARDYLSTQSSVPNVSATNTLSYNLYNAGVMPSRLSYSGTSSALTGLTAGTEVYKSPLGHDFFVQYPNGDTSGAPKYFEVRIGLVDTTGSFSSVNQCLQLMPKLIGTTRAMIDRGLVGYSYGSVSSWLTGVVGNPINATATSTLTPLTSVTATQLTACQSANDVRLYFSMRP